MQTGTETEKTEQATVSPQPANARRQAAEYLDLWETHVCSTAAQGAPPRSGSPWTRR